MQLKSGSETYQKRLPNYQGADPEHSIAGNHKFYTQQVSDLTHLTGGRNHCNWVVRCDVENRGRNEKRQREEMKG